MAWGIIALVIAAFVVVVLLIFLRRLFEGLVKLFACAIVIFLSIAVVYGIIVYKDLADLRQNFAHSTKKVMLMDGDEALVGLLLNGETRAIGEPELNKISSSIKSRDYKSALGGSYKLIIFDIKAISGLNEDISIGQAAVKKDEAIFSLRSGSEAEKAALFEAILKNNVLISDNPVFFFSQIKEGNIKVYQETALFKAARILPVGTLKSIAKNIFEKSRETAKALIIEEEKQ